MSMARRHTWRYESLLEIQVMLLQVRLIDQRDNNTNTMVITLELQE